jgi:hypothetical protein
MRIHRIGQTKKVAIKRFIVKVYLISQFLEIIHICNIILLLYSINCFAGYEEFRCELVKFR